MGKMKNFWDNSLILFKVIKKPTMSEFKRVSLIAGLGILVIGFIGYIVLLLFSI